MQGMGDAEAALYGGLGGGIAGGVLAIVGVVTGALLGRYLQRRGKVRCEIVGWRLYARRLNEFGEAVEQPLPAELDPSFRGNFLYNFNVKFFNEKDADAGLRDLQVVFFWKGGTREHTVPLSIGAKPHEISSVLALNLPSRQWVSVDLEGSILDQEAGSMLRVEKVELRAYFPNGRPFRQTIPR